MFPVQTFLLATLLPGFGFFCRGGENKWAKRVAFAGVFLLLIALIWVGRSLGNIALMMLLSFHVTSVLYAVEPQLAASGLRFRIVFSLLVMLGFWTLIYGPIRGVVERHVFMPLNYRGKVVIVNPNFSPAGLKVGDMVAFEFQDAIREANVVVRGGVALGPVLALPRDEIVFGPTRYYRNAASQVRLPNMPDDGRLLLEEKTWLIWPDIVTRGGGATAATVSQAVLKQSVVTQERLKGKVFRRWFWWRQI
jgi:hypothetical protein